jgi:tetratricopeptide (TPR) repeat protein
VAWALAVYQSLTHGGYDVFFDYQGIASGDFERIILENIRARAHFLVLLTPSALERVGDPEDWLRREIETAIECRRNIVPLTLDGFDFGAPSIAKCFEGSLSPLRNYNALNVPPDYFEEAMRRLQESYLNVALEAVLHPASSAATQAAKVEQGVASAAPPVLTPELTAEQWFERGYRTSHRDEKIRCYSEAIRLKPDYAYAHLGRGMARSQKGDVEGALKDYGEGIRLRPDLAETYEGVIRKLERKRDSRSE